MSRQDHTESKTTRQSVESTETTNVQSARVLASPYPSTSNVASTEDTTHEKTPFNVSSMSLPADTEPMHRKMTTFRHGYGAVNPRDGCIDSTSTPTSGDYIYPWPLPSPGISEVQLQEFLNLQETQDISAYPTDPTNQCGSYVPMQARPLLSYTEHQRAIHFPRPQFPAGVDPHELIHFDDSVHKSANCVSGKYLGAEELYDVSLKPVHTETVHNTPYKHNTGHLG